MSDTRAGRRTVMTTSNGYDRVLLIDDDEVVGAWPADDISVREYLRSGAEADKWAETCPDWTTIPYYGDVIGERGVIDDPGRAADWADVIDSAERMARQQARMADNGGES